MDTPSLILAVLWLPLAALLLRLALPPAFERVATTMSGLAFGLAAVAVAGCFASPGSFRLWSLEWLPELEVVLQLDGASAASMLLVTALAFVPAGFPASRRTRATIDLLTFSLVGLALAANPLAVLVFWVLSGGAITLVLLSAAEGRPRTGPLVAMHAGDIAMALAFLLLHRRAGGLDPADLTPLTSAALFVAWATRAAQVPMHRWLLEGAQLPAPAAALVQGAAVGSGVMVAARIMPAWEFFGGDEALPTALAAVGAVSAVAAAIAALLSDDLRRVLALSTITYMGLALVALGSAPSGAAVALLVGHGGVKACLVLVASTLVLAGGSARVAAITAALVLSGLPFLGPSGVLASILEGAPGWTYFAVAAALVLAPVGLVRALVVALRDEPAGDEPAEGDATGRAIPAWALLTAGALAGNWLVPLVGHQARGHAAAPLLEHGIVLAGLVVGGGAGLLLGRRGRASETTLVPLARVAAPAALLEERVAVASAGALAGLASLADWFDRHVVAWVTALCGAVVVALGALAARFDRTVVDGGLRLAGRGVLAGGQRLRRMQTGRVRDSLVLAVLSLIVLVAIWQIVLPAEAPR